MKYDNKDGSTTIMEMGMADDPASIIQAAHSASMQLVRHAFDEAKAQVEQMVPGAPGLPWSVIDMIIAEITNKKPKIMVQDDAH